MSGDELSIDSSPNAWKRETPCPLQEPQGCRAPYGRAAQYGAAGGL